MEILARMKTILSILWKVLSTTRVVIANIFFLVMVIILLGVFFTDTEESLRQNSVLLVNPAGTLVEQRSAPEAAEALLKKMGRETARADETKTQDVIDAIRKAATDPKILALVIDSRDLQGCDTTKILDIGKAILDFKETGKPVLAHSMVYTQGQYLLSSYADTISVNPLGGVLITGFGMYQTYFKGLLDKTRINFHVFRVGDYKTAVEPFVRESMSEEAREAGREWLNGLWQAYLDEASKNRGVSPSDIVSYVENIDTRLAATGGDAARLAVNAQLVDEIKTSTQFDQLLAGKTGKRIEDLHRVGFQDYLAMSPSAEPSGKEVIGIIRARGAILPGKQPENRTGSESIAELFQKARQDPTILAVVLRLDSPGGSAAASEEIHHEIARTQEAGKPVVVSMGSVAASGAYWIASGANRIVAAPTTLTGSIGIFAAFPTFEDTAMNLGITTDGIGTTGLADLGNPLRPLSAQSERAIGQLLRFGYDLFINRVASGRRLPAAEVESSAQGRVFLGREAHGRKLIDQLGNLDDALRTAASLAGLTVVNSKELRREPSPHEKILQAFFSSAQVLFTQQSPAVSRLLNMVETQAQVLESFADPNHIYARSMECEGSLF
ncbi:protease-4 [Desulfomicrobium apsheronum]|uniref:Protease-4 n=1 Tax=Desulfomicrobium apsheronum TaxID=52560 RepID=A0A1I3SK99_9BACT|nr:signal peptide peptidase SppA [Desulfomicrobium apsheronum]SFJ59188.1 protease-4 [Desulfomicrobium apsheronum]